jgi:hypothetical protein
MKWTTLNFGKHMGRTLPQVVLSDPNWVFWAISKGVFNDRLGFEADALERRATNIRIPKRHSKKWEVEYRWDRDGRFLGFDFVESKSGFHHALFSRLPHLDLTYVRRGNIHDIRDCRRLINDFRRLYFEGLNLTKERCEWFFGSQKHFTKAGWGSVFS